MPGRFLLTLSAITLFAVGGAALFAPDEVATFLEPGASRAVGIAVQLFGGSLMGFGLVNWMSRKNRIGGIYARPLGLGNALLFTTAALTLGKATSHGYLQSSVAGLCVLFTIFALSFAWLVFGHDPVPKKSAGWTTERSPDQAR